MLMNLLAEMTRYNVSKADIKALWKCSDRTVDNKLNGITSIDFDEAVIVRDTFFEGFRLEYLFKSNRVKPIHPEGTPAPSDEYSP